MASTRQLSTLVSALVVPALVAGLPATAQAQGSQPAGEYSSTTSSATVFYNSPDFSTSFFLDLEIHSSVAKPKDGAATSSQSATVTVEQSADGLGFIGCYELTSSQYSFDSRSGASVHVNVTDATPTCGQDEILKPFQLDATITTSGPVRTQRIDQRSNCLDYRLQSTHLERFTGANFTVSMTPTLPNPITASDSGVLRTTDEQTHIEGTPHESCPEQPGAVAGGAGPPNPGQYRSTSSQAELDVLDQNGRGFGFHLQDSTDTASPQGAPSTSTHLMQVRLTVAPDLETFFVGCFNLAPSDFTFNGITGAELNLYITDATPTCDGFPTNLPLPQTLHVIWTAAAPVANFQFNDSFDCLTYHAASQGSLSTTRAQATATLTPLLSDPISSDQATLTSSQSQLHAAGKKQPECRI